MDQHFSVYDLFCLFVFSNTLIFRHTQFSAVSHYQLQEINTWNIHRSLWNKSILFTSCIFLSWITGIHELFNYILIYWTSVLKKKKNLLRNLCCGAAVCPSRVCVQGATKSPDYSSTGLEQNLLSSVRELGLSYRPGVLQQDNGPTYTENDTQEWLRGEPFTTSLSTDLNPF